MAGLSRKFDACTALPRAAPRGTTGLFSYSSPARPFRIRPDRQILAPPNGLELTINDWKLTIESYKVTQRLISQAFQLSISCVSGMAYRKSPNGYAVCSPWGGGFGEGPF